MVSMKFHRHEIVNDYNYGMNNVDRADQIRGSYRFDPWTRTRKWWWSIWLWGVQVLLVNAYVCYIAANTYTWKTKKSKLMSHYEFQKAVALHWINPELYPLHEERGKKRKRNDEHDSQTTKIRSCNTAKTSYVNDDAFNPNNGSLKVRLATKYFHCPKKPVAKDPTCSLHRWAAGENGIKHRGGIVTCDCCNVNLCLDCFGHFHCISDVKKLRAEVQKKIIKKNISLCAHTVFRAELFNLEKKTQKMISLHLKRIKTSALYQ